LALTNFGRPRAKYAAISVEGFEKLMAKRGEQLALDNARITVNLLDDDKAPYPASGSQRNPFGCPAMAGF
jgi:hypothetical protein